jgi:outer membrane protein OmpA-like peptidoglycan-associated protein
MMRSQLRGVVLVVCAPALLTACATKGFVRKEVAQVSQQVTREHAWTDSAITAERSARTAADQQLTTDLASLRTDLTALRTEFGAKIAQVEDGLRFAMPVKFAFDDATVRDEDRAALERFAKVVQKYYPGATITVEGFADPRGAANYNLNLSRRRADNVREFLTAQGLDGTKLRSVGMGETRLVVVGAAKDDPGADQNRRVVFVVESADAAASAIALREP